MSASRFHSNIRRNGQSNVMAGDPLHRNTDKIHIAKCTGIPTGDIGFDKTARQQKSLRFPHNRKRIHSRQYPIKPAFVGRPGMFPGSCPGSMMFDGVGQSRRDNKSMVARVPGTSSCQQNRNSFFFHFFPFPAQQNDTFMTISPTKTENAVN